MKRIMILCAAASLLAAGCAKQKHVGLRDDADSVAYIIGMNVGMNLLRMDSTLRADVVCEGLRDAMRGATRMTREEIEDSVKDARELAEVFSTIAGILESLLPGGDGDAG